MRRGIAVLLLLALAACAARGGASGPYVGGSFGGSSHGDARTR